MTAQEELARIASLLKSQEVCPEPFKMTPGELALCILFHAKAACRAAKFASGQERAE